MSKCHEYQPNKATKTGGNDMSTSNSHKSRRYIDCCSQTKDQRNAVDCILPIQQNVQSWARFSMRWLKKCLVSLQSTPLCICAFHRISLALFCMCLCVSFVSFAFYVYDPHAFRPCLYQSMQAAFVHVCCVFVWPTVWIRFSPSMWLHWLQQQLHGQLNDSYNCQFTQHKIWYRLVRQRKEEKKSIVVQEVGDFASGFRRVTQKRAMSRSKILYHTYTEKGANSIS